MGLGTARPPSKVLPERILGVRGEVALPGRIVEQRAAGFQDELDAGVAERALLGVLVSVGSDLEAPQILHELFRLPRPKIRCQPRVGHTPSTKFTKCRLADR
jgi:hypothetical protein